jgi:methionyl-tRNA formyltransferase
MKILCCGYRDWAFEIYKNIDSKNLYFIKRKGDFSIDKVLEINPDLILFYGWSWMIPKETVEKFYCVMLHPSPLPKYRGGSPIQNQIINGEKESSVTLFKINSEIDAGQIIDQESFSLEGDLEKVLERIITLGTKLTNKMLNNFKSIKLRKQNENEATLYKRRKPEESEIFAKDFNDLTAKQVHNKIRCLQDPYPNAYIRCKDGTKLFFKKSDYEKH